MIGVVVISHGKLAQAMVETAEMIVGAQRNVHAVGLEPDRNLAWLRDEVEKVMPLADEGEGILFMVDLFGGTPANAVAANPRLSAYECLCGVNLPMLLEVLIAREQMSLQDLSTHVLTMACQSVINLKAALIPTSLGTRPTEANP